MRVLRVGYSVQTLDGHVVACNLSLDQAVTIARADRYRYMVRYTPAVVQSMGADTSGGHEITDSGGRPATEE